MTELEQLTELCVRLGASADQAGTMAAQLQKRATQFVEERGVSREEAMSYLLEVMVKARQGESLDEVKAPRPPPSMREKLLALFHETYGRGPTVITRAPGRIEFIGNHTDYNGGTVLGAAIDRGLWVAVASNENGQRRFASEQHPEIVTLAVDDLAKQLDGKSWINYPLGVLAAFPKFDLHDPAGFDFLVISDLPTGAGLSSSAALELSSAMAFLQLSDQPAKMETVVKVGHYAENNFVGLPCGMLDQAVSGFGKKDHLVYIDCRGPKFSTVAMPAEARLWVFNTHTKHALVDGAYAARHRECMEAAEGLGVKELVEISPKNLAADLAKLAPVPAKRAQHVVEEIARVEATVAALAVGDLEAVGRLLTASHRSSQHLFENSTEELDFLVDALITQPGVYGARLTGGGFGGAVMALTNPEFGEDNAEAVAKLYAEKFGTSPDILRTQTGDGAEVI